MLRLALLVGLVLFVALVIAVVMTIVKTAGARRTSATAPVLTIESRVVSKRTTVIGGGRATPASATCYATFEPYHGSPIELELDPTTYDHLAEGDWGQLTFQGPRYLSFVRSGELPPASDLR